MAKMFLGPGIIGAAQYSTGTSTAYYAGIGLDSNNVAPTLETWSPTASNTTSLYRSAVCYRMIYASTTTPTANKYLAGGPANSTRLNVYKGGRPSVANMTNLNNYASDLLISFPIPAYSTSTSSSGVIFNFGPYFTSGTTAGTSGLSKNLNYHYDMFKVTLGVCPTFVQASASGNATWFWFGNYSNPSNLSGLSFVTGSVGKSNSGSDLEMADTLVDSTGLYKCFGFKFIIPAEYTV